MSNALRRAGYPLRLAWIRLARRGEHVVLVAFGIAAGAALLAVVLAGSLIARDRNLSRAGNQLAPQDRAVRLFWGGIASGAANDPRPIDKIARDAVTPLAGAPIRAMLFRQSEANGHAFDLGAVDGLQRFLRLRSGRSPRPCMPTRCEVVQLGGSGPMPKIPGLNLVRVGRGGLTSTVPLGHLITRETSASILSTALLYHTVATPPFLLAEGVAGLARAPALAPTYRSYLWTAALKPGEIHPWEIDAFAREVQQTRSRVEAQSLAFDLTAPVDELRAADADGRVAARRLLLIGGEAAALLLAFAVLAAAGLRRDVEAQWRRLTWYGARRWQLVSGTAAEVTLVAFLGALVGWIAGIGVAAFVADRSHAPIGAILGHSTLSGHGVLFGVVIAVAAALVVLLSLRAGATRVGALTVTPVDAAALGAVVAIVIALARGAADTNALAQERGTGAVLLLLPALVAFVAAVVAARALGPVLSWLERSARGAPAPLRLAALSLARNPGRAAIAVAFLVVSLGLALFAESYRATLVQGQRDQATFAAPVSDIVRENLTRLVPVLKVAPVERFRSLAPGTSAFAVLRQSGNVRRLEGSQDITVLGIPASNLTALDWRRDDANDSLQKLQQLLRPAGDMRLHGVPIPRDGRRLTVPFHARGDEIAIRAVFITPLGTSRGIALGTTRSSKLSGAIPPEARGGLLVGFIFDLTSTGLHGVPNGGINASPIARGVLTLDAPRVDGRPLAFHPSEWSGGAGTASGSRVRLRYLLTEGSVATFRVKQPTDDKPVPVAATRSLADAAGPGGIIPIDVGNGTINARIVAIARRVPTVNGDAVLADAGTLANALDANAPGAGALNEVWVDAPPEHVADLDAKLRKPPFDALSVTSQRALSHELRTEPLARGTLVTLVAAAIAALILALAGLLLGVVSDVRDERGELFDLEAQGAVPSTLRAHLRLRTGLVALAGLLGGVATGAILAALIVALVTLTAGAGAPQPPLQLTLDWPVALLGLLAFAAVASLLVVVATRRAFRADVAGRFAEVGT